MVKEVNDLTEYKECCKKGVVCVDYFATWCPPCKMIAPKIEELERQYSSSVLFIKVDVDKASEISELEGISAMPTFKFFKNGIKVGEVVGASEEKIKEMLMKLTA